MNIKAIRGYIKDLKSKDEARLLDALDGLARFGPLALEGLPRLIELLADHRTVFRHRAVNVIGRLGPAAAEASNALLGHLNDRSPTVRRGVVRALGRIGPITLPQLLHQLRHGSTDERVHSAKAIAAFGGEATVAVPALMVALREGKSRLRVAAALALSAIGAPLDDEMDTLIEIVRDEAPKSRPSVVEALARYRPVADAAVPLLVSMITAEPEEARPLAIHALGKLGEAAVPAVPALLDLQKQADSPLRSAALVSIGRIGEPAATAVPALVELLPTEGEKRTLTIVQVLAKMGTAAEPAVPWMVNKLREAYGDLRQAIYTVLGNVGPAAAPAVPALLQATKDSAAHVRAAALQTLGRIGAIEPSIEPSLRDKEPTVRQAALSAIASLPIDTGAVEALLLAALRDTSSSVRRTAARMLGQRKLGAQAVARDFMPSLNSPYSEVRREAAEVLWDVTGRADEALPVLRDTVRDSDRAVRTATLDLLQRIARQDQRAIPVLMQALGNPDEPLTRSAARAIVALRDKAVQPLIESLDSHDKAIREGALYVAGRLGKRAEKAVPAIVPLLEDEELEVRATAIRSLGQIGSGAETVAPALVTLLTDDSESVRSWAALSLGSMGDPSVVPALLPALRHEKASTRIAALDVVVNLGPAGMGALSAIGRLLRDEDSNVRTWALRALEAISRDIARQMGDVIDLLGNEEDAYREWAVLMVLPHGKQAVPLLMPLLTRDEVRYRLGAADALGQLGPHASAAIPLLLECLADTGTSDLHVATRERVHYALTEIGHIAVPELIEAVGRKELTVRQGALDVLARLGSTAEAASTLLVDYLLKESSPALVRIMAETLGSIGTTGVDDLVSALANAKPPEAAKLAQTLGVIGTKSRSALPQLRGLLSHGDVGVRQAALWAVGRILGGRNVPTDWVEAVASCLHDIESVREQAALTLGRLGSAASAALPTVLDLARSPEAPLRATAGLTLGETLAAAGATEQGTAALLHLTRDNNPTVRGTAIQAAGRVAAQLPSEAQTALEAGLNDASPVVTWHTIQAIAAMGSAGESLLRQALTHSRPLIRREAFARLLELQPADRTALLLSGLKDPDWDICRIAADQAGSLGEAGQEAVPALCELLSSKVMVVRNAALKSLQTLDPDATATLPGLQEALLQPQLTVRSWAAEEIGKLKGKAAEAAPLLMLLIGNWRGGVSGKAIQALKSIGKGAVPAIIGALTDENPRIREQTFNNLWSLNRETQSAMQPYREQMKNPSADVMKKLKKSLASFGKEEAQKSGKKASATPIKTLIKRLKDRGSWYVRHQAAIELGSQGKKAAPAVNDLIVALKDSDYDVREKSAEALGLIGPAAAPAVPSLIEMLSDQHDKVKGAATIALGRIGHADKGAVETLVKLLDKQQKSDTLRVAAMMLGHQGPDAADALPALGKLLDHNNPKVRLWASWAISQIAVQDTLSIANLKSRLNDAHPRVQTWAALGYLQRTQDQQAMRDVLRRVLPCRAADVPQGVAAIVRGSGDIGLSVLREASEHADERYRKAAARVQELLNEAPPESVAPASG